MTYNPEQPPNFDFLNEIFIPMVVGGADVDMLRGLAMGMNLTEDDVRTAMLHQLSTFQEAANDGSSQLQDNFADLDKAYQLLCELEFFPAEGQG